MPAFASTMCWRFVAGRNNSGNHALGSVIKLNHHAEPLPAAAPSGYRELIISREGVEKPRSMVDPDGNRVRLVPPDMMASAN
jgi:hypothetical protein